MKKPISLPLVILIAILAVLVGFFLLPVYTSDHPLRAACISNVKQLTVGMLMYADKNDERFPLADSWMDSARSSAQSTGRSDLFCPFIKGRKPDQYGYAMYFKMVCRKQNSLSKPEQTVLVFESVVLDRNAATGLQGFGNRHEMVPFGFVDGHAKGFGPTMKAERDKIVTFNQAMK